MDELKKTRYIRSELEIFEDFEECSILLSEGNTWAEVALLMNNLRPYRVSVNKLRVSYSKLLKSASLQRSPEVEKERMIEDCDAIMTKVIIQFNKSLEAIDQITVTDSKFGTIKSSSKVTKTLRTHGATEYLNLYLKAMDRKIKLLGLDKETIKPFDITDFVNNYGINDGVSDIHPITSEDEALKIGQSIGRDKK